VTTPTDGARGEPDTILVGIDGSAGSCRALEWALDEARAAGRSVTLVHAVHPITPVLLEPHAPDAATAHEQSLLAKGTEVLQQARKAARPADPEVAVHEVVRIGDPREALLDLSATAALLVVGSRGRGHIRSLLLGSTSVALVRHASCPVVVHRTADDTSRRHGIAVGVDASADSSTVLDFAFRQAQLLDEPLTVVHAQHFPPTTAPNAPYAEPSWVEDEQTDVKARIETLRREHPDVTVTSVIRHGMPEHLLMDLADEVGLLVVGVHHRSRVADLTFGSMAVWLVEHAGCPVAAVPLSTEL